MLTESVVLVKHGTLDACINDKERTRENKNGPTTTITIAFFAQICIEYKNEVISSQVMCFRPLHTKTGGFKFIIIKRRKKLLLLHLISCTTRHDLGLSVWHFVGNNFLRYEVVFLFAHAGVSIE